MLRRNSFRVQLTGLLTASVLFAWTTNLRSQQVFWAKDYITDANGVVIATATPAPADQIPPSAPTNLSSSYITMASAKLSWTASTDQGGSQLLGYKIYRGALPVGTSNTTGFIDNAVQPLTNYTYTVVAVDGAGNHSAPSAGTSFTTGSFSAPTTLTATGVSSSRIDLLWEDNSSNETGFVIERKIGIGGAYSKVDTIAAGSTTYQNTGLDGGSVYYYRVRAVYTAASPSRSVTSSYTNEAYACTCTSIAGEGVYDGRDYARIAYSGGDWIYEDEVGTYPDAYDGTLHYSNIAGNKATFSFDGSNITWIAQNEYNLGLASVTIDGKVVGDIDLYSASTVWQKPYSFALGSGPHTITIAVTDRKNTSSANDFIVVDGFAVYASLAVPDAPANLSATAVSSSQINLSWTDKSLNESVFKIERKTGAGSYSEIASNVAANVTNYSDAGLSANTTYSYRLRASNSSGNSGYSNEASATASDTTPPTAPGLLSATATSASSVSLTWTASSDDIAVDHYQVQRRSTGNYTQIATPTSASYTDNSSVSANVTYVYRVRGVDGAGNTSNWSNLDLATTILFADDPLSAGVTVVKAQHITELRTALNALRATAGLSASSWTNSPASGVIIYALDVQELRTALEAGLAAFGISPPVYTNATITAGTTTIKKDDIQQVRDAVK